MKIKFFSSIIILLIHIQIAQAQGVGIGTNSPHSSALLDVVSSNRGMTAPRMSTAQRTAIAGPAKGQLVYDTNDNALYQFNGSAWAIVGNPGGGGLMLPFTHSSATGSSLFTVGNTGSLSTIFGSTQGSAAVALEGIATGTGGYGLAGHNSGNIGFGVAGEGIDNAAVSATSTGTGVALRGNSPAGYGLITNGNLKLGGSNMAPAANLVLTAIDADGNARWQESTFEKIVFAMENPTSAYNSYASNQTSKVHFSFEAYDLGNDAQVTPSFTPLTPAQSTFTVPVTGVYAFNFNLFISINTEVFCDYVGAEIKVNRSGNVSTLYTSEQYFSPSQNRGYVLRGACQKQLQAGDIIYLTFRQVNSSAATVSFLTNYGRTFFTGRLVSAE
jgi:hypothetical protein